MPACDTPGRGLGERRAVGREDGQVYGDRPDPVSAATSFVASHFADARAAILGGGVLSQHRTPTSDLDVMVLVDPDAPTAADRAAPYRETFEHEGWIVEAFVHTRDSLAAYWDHDAARRVPALLRICAEGVVVADAAGMAVELRARAAERLAAGPAEADRATLAHARYALTDLLDDMAGCDREDELAFIAGAVLRHAAELALLVAGRWSGSGKGLARALGEHDPDLLEWLVNGQRLVVLYGDTAVLHRGAVEVLMRAGGALMVGFHAAGGEPGPAVRLGPTGLGVS